MRQFMSPTEAILVDIWQDVLGVQDVAIDDDFYDLGGDSLMTTRMLVQLRKQHPTQVRLRDLAKARTIREAAAIIDDAERDRGK